MPVYHEALDQFQRLADDFPSVPDYQNELAMVSFNLGTTLIKEAEKTEDKGAVERICQEASARLGEAVSVYRRLIQPERFPHRPDYLQKLALAEGKHGILLDKTHQNEKAETAFLAAIKAFEVLDVQYPQVPEYQSDLGVALGTWPRTRTRNRPAEVPVSREIDRAPGGRVKSNPRNRYYRQFVLDAYHDLDAVFKVLGDHAGARGGGRGAGPAPP